MTFEEFYEAEHGGLFGALVLTTQSRQEAEDVMQEAFFKVWQRWGVVRDLQSPAGYLFRTAMNTFRSRRRRAALAARSAGRRLTGSDPMDAVGVRDEVDRALAKLTPRERAALVMTDLLGFPSQETANVLGIKASTVRVLVARGRETIRSQGGEVGG